MGAIPDTFCRLQLALFAKRLGGHQAGGHKFRRHLRKLILQWPLWRFSDAKCNNLDPSEHHFTGKERDIESGLDYFPARYYNSYVGRWMSPDWSRCDTWRPSTLCRVGEPPVA